MKTLTRYPRREPHSRTRWTFLFRMPGGHKFFVDQQGFLGVADDSAKDPDHAEDGNTLYVVTEAPIAIGSEGAAVPVVGIDGEPYVVLENAGNGIDLAARLGMSLKANGHVFWLETTQ